MNTEPIDIPSESQAVVVRENGGAVGKALPPEEIKPPITPAQAKIDAIAHLTMAAYEKAATLTLSKEESDALIADFADDAFQPGAAGKENLIYIEHASLRQRFNEVFGLGQWAIVSRNRWVEPFRTQRGDEGQRVYVEAMLVVRGCFVGEAIGAMEYYPKNASQNYGDAVEGAKTAAFRRCAKEFGVGLQSWRKDWCAGWWARRQNRSKGQFAQGTGLQGRRNAPQTAGATSGSGSPPPAPKPAPAPKAKDGEPNKEHLEKLRTRLLEALGDKKAICESFFRTIDWLMPNESIDTLELKYVPVSKEQFDALMTALNSSGEPKAPYPINPEPLAPKKAKSAVKEAVETAIQQQEPDKPLDWWREIIVPIPHKGQKRDEYMKHPETIGQLYDLRHGNDEEAQAARQRLWGFLENYEPKGWTKRDGTKMPPSASDLQFKEALDACKAWHEANHPEEKI